MTSLQPKRQKKDKKEVIKEKKPEIKDSVFQEEPPTPEKDTEDKESKDDGKPKSSYALDDMEKATFEAVSVSNVFPTLVNWLFGSGNVWWFTFSCMPPKKLLPNLQHKIFRVLILRNFLDCPSPVDVHFRNK